MNSMNSISYLKIPGRMALLLTLLAAATAAATASAQILPDFTRLVDENAGAIVNVSTIRRDERTAENEERLDEILRYYFGDKLPNIPEDQRREFGQPPALGSGFLISEDGYLITNHHVIEDAAEISITLNDRREFAAEVIGSDVSSDLALLKIDATGLTPARLGDSANLKVGEWVLAIGSPMGLRFSVAAGIISYMGRNIPNGSGGNYVSFIQTDVAINPGNSGGPLFNLDGEVIGINSQIFTNTGGSMGLSFAIPVDVAKNVVGQLKAKGVVERGWMGVGINEVSQAVATDAEMDIPAGALVNQVIEGSPAERAGFLNGDIITHFNGSPILSSGDLPFHVGLTAPDSVADVDIIRDGEAMTLAMTIGRLASGNRTELSSTATDRNPLGLMITDTERADAASGVLVVNVIGPVGRDAGFLSGDILLSINGQETATVDQFNIVVSALPVDKVLPVLVERDGNQFFLTLKIPG